MARLLAVAVILVEVASLILVGQAIGVLPTLLLVVLAALAGAALLRRQGADAVRGMRGALERGRDPRPALLRGGFRVVAALLLIVPGFASDLVALLLLLPPVQRVAAAALARRGLRVAEASRMEFEMRAGSARPAAPQDRVIDAEWEELPPSQRPTHRPSGWTRH